MSPREDFLRDNVPPLPSDMVVGRCPHTCTVRMNMGVKDPNKIGMRYTFVSTACVGVALARAPNLDEVDCVYKVPYL